MSDREKFDNGYADGFKDGKKESYALLRELVEAMEKAKEQLGFISDHMNAKPGWMAKPMKPNSKSNRNYEMLREPYWILEEALHRAKESMQDSGKGL